MLAVLAALAADMCHQPAAPSNPVVVETGDANIASDYTLTKDGAQTKLTSINVAQDALIDNASVGTATRSIAIGQINGDLKVTGKAAAANAIDVKLVVGNGKTDADGGAYNNSITSDATDLKSVEVYLGGKLATDEGAKILPGDASNTISLGENAVLSGATQITANTAGKITVAKLASLNNKAIDASKVNADIEITEALSDGDLTKVLSANDANDKLAVMVDSKVTNITGTAGSDTITFVAGEGENNSIDLSGSKATDVEKIIIKANDNTTSIKALPGVDNEIIVGNTPFTVELSNGATNTNDIVNVSAATLQENGDVIQPNPAQMKIYWEIKNLKAGDKIDFGQTGVNTKIVEKTVTITEKELDDAVKAAAEAAAAKAGGKQLVALDVENNEKAMQAAAAAEAKVAAALDKISKEVVGAAAPNTIYKVTIDYADHPLAGTYLAYNKTADGKLAANDDILVFLGKVDLDFETTANGLVTAKTAAPAAAEVVPAS